MHFCGQNVLWPQRTIAIVGGHSGSRSCCHAVGVVGVIGMFSLPNALHHSPCGLAYNRLCQSPMTPLTTLVLASVMAGGCGDKHGSKSLSNHIYSRVQQTFSVFTCFPCNVHFLWGSSKWSFSDYFVFYCLISTSSTKLLQICFPVVPSNIFLQFL